MTAEQIEQSAYNDLISFDWESGKSITSATTYARFLFEAYFYFFYVPATAVFFCVERDGDYYHGYETIVKKCSKADVLRIVERNLTYLKKQAADPSQVIFWEEMHAKLLHFF